MELVFLFGVDAASCAVNAYVWVIDGFYWVSFVWDTEFFNAAELDFAESILCQHVLAGFNDGFLCCIIQL